MSDPIIMQRRVKRRPGRFQTDRSGGSALTTPVLLAPVTTAEAARDEGAVAYCDVCRRWGQRGTTHVCGLNWSEHLLPLLARVGLPLLARVGGGPL